MNKAILQKQMQELEKERAELTKKLNDFKGAITILQNLCDHKMDDGSEAMLYEAHDSHKDYYMCVICGVSRSV